MDENRPRWTVQTRLVVSIVLLAFFVYLLSRFRPVIPPLILAVILAYILSPTVNFLQERFHIRRGVVILLSYVVLLGILITLPVVVIPTLASQVTDLNVDVQRFSAWAQSLFAQRLVFAGRVVDLSTIFDQVIGSLQGLLEPVIGQTLSLLVDVISSIVWVIFILIVAFYLIRDNNVLHQWFETLPPPAYRQDFILLRDEINRIWGAFFRGQLALATIVAIIFIIVGFILGLPFALAMGILAGLLEFLPSIGHGIWLTIASLLAFALGSSWLPIPNWVLMLIVIGLHLIFEQFDLNYLIPRVIGRSVHLSPLVVILGIVAGAAMAGIMGIPLAAPTIASARVLGRYLYANLFDLDPFPTSMVQPLPPPNPQWWRSGKKKEEKP